jgi:nucleolar protein 56
MNSHLEQLREKNIELTRKKIREALKEDIYTIQLASSIEDLDKIISKMLKRLRDWYEIYLPEISNRLQDNEQFISETAKSKSELMKKYKIKESMGGDFKDTEAMECQRKETLKMIEFRAEQQKKLEKLMEKNFPNITAVAGGLIGAKLIAIAGSIKELSEFPASTIQILGAEKALFRHMRSGARPPKYGIILSHPYVAESKEKAKSARKLADKISIASKVDYFKGRFIGDKLKEQLK